MSSLTECDIEAMLSYCAIVVYEWTVHINYILPVLFCCSYLLVSER